ncbi:hypothetical protein TKK_0005518 [Trichogramma kaykai]
MISKLKPKESDQPKEKKQQLPKCWYCEGYHYNNDYPTKQNKSPQENRRNPSILLKTIAEWLPRRPVSPAKTSSNADSTQHPESPPHTSSNSASTSCSDTHPTPTILGEENTEDCSGEHEHRYNFRRRTKQM